MLDWSLRIDAAEIKTNWIEQQAQRDGNQGPHLQRTHREDQETQQTMFRQSAQNLNTGGYYLLLILANNLKDEFILYYINIRG